MAIENDRVSDYYFNRKEKLKTTKKFTLPVGYKITSLPKGMSKKYPDFSFEVSYKLSGNQVFYSNEITVNQGIVKKNDFGLWNDCIKELKDTYNDQLVLTKSKYLIPITYFKNRFYESNSFQRIGSLVSYF